MTSEKINTLMEELRASGVTQGIFLGYPLFAKVNPDQNQLYLQTKVYSGGNYIPPSVRQCVKNPPLSTTQLRHTKVQVDEKNFQIYFFYQGDVDLKDEEEFKNLIDHFCWAAEEWRFWIDDHDERDRSYVRAN